MSRFKAEVSGDLRAIFARYRKRVDEQFDIRLKRVLTMFSDLALENTPVWSGGTIASWRWSVDTPDHVVAVPDGSAGPPGPAIWGREHRRADNEKAPRASLERVLQTRNLLGREIFFTNASPTAIPLELGQFPNARDRGGMIHSALQQVRAHLSGAF